MEKTKERLELMKKIVDRAKELDLIQGEQISLFMDLEFVDEKIGLRLEEMLGANEAGFAHDILGIQKNFNRGTKEMENFFLPRFSLSK